MLDKGLYEVGQIPSRPIVVALKDERGNALSLAPYNVIRFRMKGSDNEDVDLTDADVQVMGGGRVALHLPTTRSVFTKKGEYVFDLELSGPFARDYTSTGTIRVTQLGGTK
jgi:hypothetical protein